MGLTGCAVGVINRSTDDAVAQAVENRAGERLEALPGGALTLTALRISISAVGDDDAHVYAEG